MFPLVIIMILLDFLGIVKSLNNIDLMSVGGDTFMFIPKLKEVYGVFRIHF